MGVEEVARVVRCQQFPQITLLGSFDKFVKPFLCWSSKEEDEVLDVVIILQQV